MQTNQVQAGLIALQGACSMFFWIPRCSSAPPRTAVSADHNERLEFLGDSVLNLAVASLLYQRLSALPEGDLARRANLVKQDTLHQLAVRLKVSEVLRLGEGEAKSGGQQRPSILCGRIGSPDRCGYLDAAMPAQKPWCIASFQGVRSIADAGSVQGRETALQSGPGPQNEAAAVQGGGDGGAAHRQTFDVECDIPELGLSGVALAGRAGGRAAAAAMLGHIESKEFMNDTKDVAADDGARAPLVKTIWTPCWLLRARLLQCLTSAGA